MKNNTINGRRQEFRRAIIAAGIDINADFFVLSWSDLDRLVELARAFFYSAQRAKQ